MKENLKKRKSGPRRVLLTALVMSALIVAVSTWRCLFGADFCSWTSFWLTADQQAQRLYHQENYSQAGEKFMDSEWRAAALYRAGEFKAAAGIYAGIATAKADYNHGNALTMLGQYQDAVDKYDRALSVLPEWEEAAVNRSIAVERAKRLEKQGGNMTGGMLGADEFSFEKGRSAEDQSIETIEDGVPNPAEMRAIWLRQVQTKPADFLRSKFAYQRAMQDKTP